jgi:hypothetical protein
MLELLISAGEGSDFTAEIIGSLLDTFTHFEADKTANRDALACFGRFFGDQISNRLGRILYERLV